MDLQETRQLLSPVVTYYHAFGGRHGGRSVTRRVNLTPASWFQSCACPNKGRATSVQLHSPQLRIQAAGSRRKSAWYSDGAPAI